MPRQGSAKVLTEDEFKRLLKVVEAGGHAKRNLALLYFSFGLGLRAKELAALKIEDVMDAEEKILEEINLLRHMTKGDRQRHVYLSNPKIRKAIKEYLDERKPSNGLPTNRKEPLFRSQKGNHFSPNALQQLFHLMYDSAGITGASSHSGRRTFATRLIEKGVDIKAVSKLMGHASIAMTARYVEDNPVRLKKIAEDVF